MGRRRLFAAAGLSPWLLCSAAALAQERTPRAGEACTEVVFGRSVTAPARDRAHVTAISLGFQWIPEGLEQRGFVPAGALFLWRNPPGGDSRLRAVVSGLYDDVQYDRGLAPGSGLVVVATFENVTLPFARSEYAEGRRIAQEELTWGSVRAGVGLGYRHALAPGNQDNAFEASIAYEPGFLYFGRGDDTEESFGVPRSTYEGTVHLKIRADAFERNILELPHRGWAAGLDAYAGHRARWEDWGGSVSGIQSGQRGANWQAVSVFALAAAGVPGVPGERHSLIASAYAAAGHHLDRFSAFRLGGGSNAGDFEALSQPVLPAAAFDEFFTSRYGVVNLEYRYQVFFFLYLQARGTLARFERPRFSPSGLLESRTENFRAVTAGLTSGLFWDSSLELDYAYNFDLLRQRNGVARSGGSAVYLLWSKEFRKRR